MSRTVQRIGGLVAMAFLLSACGAASPASAPAKGSGAPASASNQAAKLTDITVSLPVRLETFAPLFVAEGKGFFRQQGLKVKFVAGGGDPQVLASLISGGAQFAASAAETALKLASKGRKPMVVEALNIGVPEQIVLSNQYIAKKHLRSHLSLKQRIAALKGARIGVISIGGADEVVARYTMVLGGLAQNDVRVVKAPSVPDKVADLKDGLADGAAGSPPLGSLAVKAGVGRVWLSVNDLSGFQQNIWECLFALNKYVKAHPSIVQKMVRAATEGLAFVRAHPRQSAAVMAPYFQGLKPAAILSTLRPMLPVFKGDGSMTQQMWNQTLKPWALFAKSAGFTLPKSTKQGSFWTDRFFHSAA